VLWSSSQFAISPFWTRSADDLAVLVNRDYWKGPDLMRIAQVAPLCESVPPKLYGGTERVVSWLTEDLVRFGHDVTRFASGDSLTSARLVPACKKALRLDSNCVDPLAPFSLKTWSSIST
jgi:hypothetical protein